MKLLKLMVYAVMVSPVLCDYQLRVRVHSYLNPDSRCAACTRSLSEPVFGCCDNPTNTGVCSGVERCDTFFRYCLRPLGQRGVECPVNDATGRNTAVFSPDTDVLLDVGDTVLGSDNPLIIFGPSWTGFQFYLRALDSDMPDGGGVKDIDSFTVDLTIEGGQRLEQRVYEGWFELAEIELSFELVCTDNHSLPDCTPCQPGSSQLCVNRQVVVGPVANSGPDRAVLGGVLGTLVMVAAAIVIVVTLLITYKCLSKRKNELPTLPASGAPAPPLGDNPVYAAHETRSDKTVTSSCTLSLILGVGAEGSCESEEREFDNPLYSDPVEGGGEELHSAHWYATVDETRRNTHNSVARYEPAT